VSFLHAAALAIAVLVVAPLVAHLLQRRASDVRDFPPARLVPPSPPLARRRRNVDDRLLFAVRTAAVVALALLGATPFVRCSGLALGRHAGASVALAIVLDDSLSMLARSGGATRWQRALEAARDLVSGAREGDAIGIVLAGAPARVALASTTDLAAARAALSALAPSHRATDLEGALELGRALVRGLPQVDRRLVLLSDMSDGHPEGPPLGESEGIALWVPLDELRAPVSNCAVLVADRQRERVSVRVACSPAAAARGRSVEIRAKDAPEKALGAAPLRDVGQPVDLAIEIHDPATDLVAALTGTDAIADDDAAPVLAMSGALSIAIIADPTNAKLATGGPPPAEQAVSALQLDVQLRPLPLVPDRAEDFAALGGVIIDDPPGFTPESRRALGRWLERGGVALVALGPRAALAPLGATFEPILGGPVTWAPSAVPGLDEPSAMAFGTSGPGLLDIRPRGRAMLELGSLGKSAKVVARWKDGAPWLIERPIGRGLVFVLTVPTSTEESDLALRPAFLALLETFTRAARARHGAYRTEVGEPWVFEGATSLRVKGPRQDELAVTAEATRKVVHPDRIGAYEILVDGDRLSRVAAAAEREVDLRSRPVAPSARAAAFGELRANTDVSSYVALALLALLAGELSLRGWARRTSTSRAEQTVNSP